MQLLAASAFLDDLRCPACTGGSLRAAGDASVECAGCGRAYPCSDGVADFVLVERLNEESRREHATNRVDLSSDKLVRRVLRKARGEGSPLLVAQTRRNIRVVDRMLPPGDEGVLASVGSGAGLELTALLERRRFARVYSSDLASSATALVPRVLEGFGGELGLFAADYDHLPVRKRPGLVGFVYLALHHSDDPHGSLERLLERNFEQLVVVEPVTNRLVELLARLGLARKLEYSGLRPVWFDVKRVRRIAAAHGFALEVQTWWEIPRNQLPRRLRASRRAWWPLYAAVVAVSAVTRPFRFGSMGAFRFVATRPG